MGAGAIEALLRARFNVRKRLRAVSHLAGSVFFDLFDFGVHHVVISRGGRCAAGAACVGALVAVTGV